MEGYEQFAYVYDLLTNDIDYTARAAYFDSLNTPRANKKGVLLDLGCGTGKLSRAFEKLGYSVIGVDVEEDMLSVASSYPGDILYLCQDMRELDLYGKVGTAVCALDSLNHLLDSESVKAVFERVSTFLEPGGLFIFDVNTIYKHRKVLSQNVFIRDYDEVYLSWENQLSSGDVVMMNLNYFVKNKQGLYERYNTTIQERAYSESKLRKWLQKAGLRLINIYEGDSMKPPGRKTQRAVFVAQKMPKQVEKQENL